MKSLQEDFKTGQLKRVYLLYGEEAYLKRQYRDKLRCALISPDDNMNYGYYEGKDVNVREVIDMAETLPFFAERRLLVLENTGFFKNATPELADYMDVMPETTAMVFVESEVDKRSKLYKSVQKLGRVVEMNRQGEDVLIRWIAGSVKKEGKQITEATVRYFLTKVGTDMENIQKELEKLFCYVLEKDTITSADVDAICTTQITNHIFDMVNAVAAGQQKKALDYYYDLLTLKEPPMRILFLLTKQFKQLLEVKTLSETGHGKQEIASKVGLYPFVAGKYMDQARAFSKNELRTILEESVDIEESVKTGNLTDTLGVELFIIKHSASARGKRQQ